MAPTALSLCSLARARVLDPPVAAAPLSPTRIPCRSRRDEDPNPGRSAPLFLARAGPILLPIKGIDSPIDAPFCSTRNALALELAPAFNSPSEPEPSSRFLEAEDASPTPFHEPRCHHSHALVAGRLCRPSVLTKPAASDNEQKNACEKHKKEEQVHLGHITLPIHPSTLTRSSYHPSHDTQYHGGGSASRQFGRDQGPSASARFHTDNMVGLNSAIQGMNLGRYNQRLYQQVNDIYQRTETMDQRL
ncbi:hypothetical protein U9M48_012491 [Paspalum notatum var. saurae]|uniref:Uncharacterized protein n=1 Tax=Paspalum notatum var. saurae TaxID=547442 RepID=A0AAQ3SXQ0_PASNO